ncbi:MAG: hypothetical protein PHH91_09795 [Desulfuromonadaceae bacterium]|nr:hypothetical protein [Desulfuromonadaceae bacterium]
MKKTDILKSPVPPLDNTETIAVLAEGIADNFNNILTTVLGACSLIDKDDPANGELQQCVALIRGSAERAAALTDRLASAITLEQENVRSGRHPSETSPAERSVDDKKTIDDIVTATNNPGGAVS